MDRLRRARLDEPPPESPAEAFIRQKQPDRPGADDEDISIRRSIQHAPSSRHLLKPMSQPMKPGFSFGSALEAVSVAAATRPPPVGKIRRPRRRVSIGSLRRS